MVLKSVLGDYASLGMLGVALVAILANSSSIDPEDSIPWEVTLACTCGILVSAIAILAKKPVVAYVVVGSLVAVAPTYYTFHREVHVHNWTFGSAHGVKAPAADVLRSAWQTTPNVTRFDWLLPGSLTVADLSLVAPSVQLYCNTSEIFHSGMELKDPTGAKTHDYLLASSPRKVRREVAAVMTLLKVPVGLEAWPQGADMTLNLEIASGIVKPHLFSARALPLDKGQAMDVLRGKHHLRPFLLDVYALDHRNNMHDAFGDQD